MDKFKIWRLPFIAFVVGFVLMVFELAAARLLAPTLGSSIYVWTSVIGGIIASLSVGVWLGGKYADKRNKESDLAWILLGCGLTIGLMLLFAEYTLAGLSESGLDPRLSGVLAAILLFAPTSFMIGACSPYLAKFNVTSLKDTGKSVANLDAMNALGGITGTFLTGFVLFAVMGTRSIFAALILLTVLLSWVIRPRAYTMPRIAASIGLMLLAAVSIKPVLKVDSTQINTASSSYVIATSIYNNQHAKLLTTSPIASQSGIDINSPDKLLFWYTQEIAHVIKEQKLVNPKILILGGGAFTLPEYLAKAYPDGHVDTVEIDTSLLQIAKDHFNFNEQPNLTIINQDARSFLHTNKQQYDIVAVDVYSDVSVPFALATKEYGQNLVKAVNPNGIVIVNSIGNHTGACKQLLDATLLTYSDNFKYGLISKRPGSDSRSPSNNIAVFSNRKVSLSNDYQVYTAANSLRLTDDYAPIEPIQYKCSYL